MKYIKVVEGGPHSVSDFNTSVGIYHGIEGCMFINCKPCRFTLSAHMTPEQALVLARMHVNDETALMQSDVNRARPQNRCPLDTIRLHDGVKHP